MLNNPRSKTIEYNQDKFVIYRNQTRDTLVGITVEENKRLLSLIYQYHDCKKISNDEIIDCYLFDFSVEKVCYILSSSKFITCQVNELSPEFIHIKSNFS